MFTFYHYKGNVLQLFLQCGQEKIMINTETQKYLIHVLKCVLEGKKPDEKPKTVNFEDIFAMASFHKVEGMAFYGIDMLNTKPEKDLLKKWTEIKNQHIYRHVVQNIEQEKIINVFSNAYIQMLPIKGLSLKKLYPNPEYRWMNDIDILVKKEDFDKAKSIIEDMGYEVLLEIDKDIEYFKKPLLQVEIHHDLLEKRRAHYDYFKDVWTWVVPCDGSGFIYKMPVEKEYIYLLEHAGIHFNGSGTGIRTVMDLYLFRNKHIDAWNAAYIDGQLKKLDLKDFSDKINMIGEAWFGNGTLDPAMEEFENCIMDSGVFGTKKHFLENDIAREFADGDNGIKSVFNYIFKRAFLPYEKMLPDYPVLEKCPVLLPFCWIHKCLRVVLFRREKFSWIYNAIKSNKSK